MSAAALIERARQGDGDAIASLINQSLQPKGITVTTTLSRNFLTVLAQAETTPDQKAITQFIEKSIGNLKPQGIERIVIKGKASDQRNPAWRSLVELAQPANQNLSVDAKVQQWRGSGRAKQAITWLKGTRGHICSSEKPLQAVPPTPTLSGSEPKCAAGSQAID